MPGGPLDHAGLRLIDDCITRGELQHAQQLLSALPDSRDVRHGASYLATRLLYEKGRLDEHAVAERLRDLLRVTGVFPEAEQLLELTEAGKLQRVAAATEPPGALETGAADLDAIEALFAQSPARAPSLPTIPKAPALPQFAQPADLRPSYVPPGDIESAHGSRLGLSYARTQPKFEAVHYAEPSTQPPPPSDAPRSVRSGPPPDTSAFEGASLIDVAALLDQGRYDDALEALERASLHGPDQQLLRARALHGESRRHDAIAALHPLCQAPLLEPELRGSCARLLLELDELDRALEQSERAHHDDPESLFLRLTLAWCKMRVARRTGERRLIDEAESLLHGIHARNVPLPALVLALQACIEAHVGDTERAVSRAQRALAIDPRSIDALWALGLASARMDRAHDAKQAFIRLLGLSLVEARLLAAELSTRGVTITGAPNAPELEPPSGDSELWHPLERALVSGDRARVAVGIERLCRDALAGFGSRDFMAMAAGAAEFFSTAPVWHHFAPFDLSLWSVPRVAAALNVIYGLEPSASAGDDDALIELVGSYVGETLRLATCGTWVGSREERGSARVVCDAQQWRPFELVLARLRRGLALSVEGSPALLGADTLRWRDRVQAPASPPLPWGDSPWPAPGQLPELGRALGVSVVATYCAELAGGPLDCSVASLTALDRYLNLIAPPNAPLDEDPVWARRISVLLGAYVGETVRTALGGHWDYEPCAAIQADAYLVVLPSATSITPVAHVMARVLGDTQQPLAEYGSGLLRGRGRDHG